MADSARVGRPEELGSWDLGPVDPGIELPWGNRIQPVGGPVEAGVCGPYQVFERLDDQGLGLLPFFVQDGLGHQVHECNSLAEALAWIHTPAALE